MDFDIDIGLNMDFKNKSTEELHTIDEKFITLMPPNFNNEVLIMNNMQVTYLVNPISTKEKISIYLRRFDKHIILATPNIQIILYDIAKNYKMKLLKNFAYPKNFFKLILYTPDAEHRSELILKAFYKKKKLYLHVYYDKYNPLDNHFLDNFY
jgi:hypothetical protein